MNIFVTGGSGFIGSSLTNALCNKGHQICVVCSDKERALDKLGLIKGLQVTAIDVLNENAVRHLVKDHDIIINLIGKLFEAKKGDFSKFHHKFPEFLSKNISDKQRLIHISALGIEGSCKTSIYAQTKLDGQKAIIKNSKNYNIIKPSIVFGDCDNFFNLFAKMSKTSPFLPLIGGGKAKFSPIYVEDLVKSIALLVEDNKKYKNKIFESYGPDTSSFKELMQFILKITGRRRFLINLPFSIAKIQATLLNMFRIYLLTPDQVELLKYDNIASNKHDNIDKIIGNLKSFKQIVPKYLR